MVQIIIFGGRNTFGSMTRRREKFSKEGDLFNPVLFVDNTLLCMFQRLCTYFQDTGVRIFEEYVLSGHCSQQQISIKREGVLIFGGVLIYGVLR